MGGRLGLVGGGDGRASWWLWLYRERAGDAWVITNQYVLREGNGKPKAAHYWPFWSLAFVVAVTCGVVLRAISECAIVLGMSYTY